MKKEDYIKTLIINNTEIKLGMDDYGQCYYIEYTDGSGKLQELGLGTYNSFYLEEIYYLFDPEYKSLAKKSIWGTQMTPEEKDKWLKYQELFEEEYKNVR